MSKENTVQEENKIVIFLVHTYMGNFWILSNYSVFELKFQGIILFIYLRNHWVFKSSFQATNFFKSLIWNVMPNFWFHCIP